MEDKLQTLSKAVLDKILDGDGLSEDILYELTKACYRQFRDNAPAPDRSNEFHNLKSYINAAWRSRQYRAMEPDVIFDLGRIFGMIDLLNLMEEEVSGTATIEEDAKRYQGKYFVFEAIRRQKGITHKELAGKARMTESALSQFLTRIQYSDYIVSRKLGRSKYYYLTKNGERLLAQMKPVQCEYGWIDSYAEAEGRLGGIFMKSKIMPNQPLGIGAAIMPPYMETEQPLKLKKPERQQNILATSVSATREKINKIKMEENMYA